MGYYTYYELAVKGADAQRLSEIIEWLKRNQMYGIFKEPYDDGRGIAEFSCRDSMKWYSWREDMTELSEMMPEVTFRLHGEGEENGDIWDAYFKNGAWEQCTAQLTMPKPERITW